MGYTPPPEFEAPGFLQRLRDRERDAVARVVHEYLPQILRAARGAGLDETAADDVTQQTFLTFIETLPRFEGRSHVRTWLFGCRHLEECLETVPERHRLAFVLKEIEGLASSEICHVLELTVTNLGVILYRARNRLRECLEGRGFAEGS